MYVWIEILFLSRGKRISKVKTLLNAIQYIKDLEIILNQQEEYDDVYVEVSNMDLSVENNHFFSLGS